MTTTALMIPTLLTTNTSSGATTSVFTSSIDSTYDHYMFVCTDINIGSDNAHFQMQVNASGQSGYNETMTSSAFLGFFNEAGNDTSMAYSAGNAQAQATDGVNLTANLGNGSDESCAGIIHLFAPSNTTYATHFISRFNQYHLNDATVDQWRAGYFNVTAAITQVQFDASDGGTFDGVIQMYGVA